MDDLINTNEGITVGSNRRKIRRIEANKFDDILSPKSYRNVESIYLPEEDLETTSFDVISESLPKCDKISLPIKEKIPLNIDMRQSQKKMNKIRQSRIDKELHLLKNEPYATNKSFTRGIAEYNVDHKHILNKNGNMIEGNITVNYINRHEILNNAKYYRGIIFHCSDWNDSHDIIPYINAQTESVATEKSPTAVIYCSPVEYVFFITEFRYKHFSKCGMILSKGEYQMLVIDQLRNDYKITRKFKLI